MATTASPGLPAGLPAFKVDNTLGALLIAGLLATALWGVTCVQTFSFFAGGTADRAWQKTLVAFLWVLDTFDTVLNGHILYFYLVSNYLVPQAILFPVWSVIVRNFLCSALPDQWLTYFEDSCCRYISNGNIPGTLLIVALSLLDLTCGLIITVKAFGMQAYSDLDSLSKLLFLNFAAGTSSDLSVALALCYLLYGSRTGFQRTDSLIRTLMLYTVNTGLLVALDATAGMFAYVFMPHNFIFLGFYLLLSKLYLNSYLAILNARKTLRRSDNPASIHLSQISRMRWRNGSVFDSEGQRTTSQPALVSKTDGDTTVALDSPVDSHRVQAEQWAQTEKIGYSRPSEAAL
ncbi:hypothetical protein GGX14DRAFT_654667 [Mycena pura]|uniref:DUF6534 domain-containing protein n=1 Tax=Mycena pura TaxID=153505 RepID=A0AAD6V4D0_9AGAR|nr:hypothetical protein GGX14DRAFT_654667 [Mycena pura]